MGCCFSVPVGPNAPYPGGAPNASSRAINSPRLEAEESQVNNPRPQPSPNRSPSSSPNRNRSAPVPRHSNRRRSHRRPLSQHIDRTLRCHVWVAKDRTWTRSQLRQERTDFFFTRVTGREEVWQTIRTALEVIWAADPTMSTLGNQGENNTALATAQLILRAADITLPTGDLANGVYDALGTYYALPEWIVSDPVNAVDDGDEQDNDSGTGVDQDGNQSGDEDTAGEDMDSDEALRRREEKGKAIATVTNTVKICARLSDNDQDVVVHVTSDEPVKNVIRKITREANIKTKKSIKLAYMGKILKDNTSLESQGYIQGHVLNAFVFG